MLDGSKTATDARFFALALRVGVYCLLWFVTSIAVIYTNKYYLSHRDFAFPFFINLFTNVYSVLAALLVRRCSAGPRAPLERRDFWLGVPIGAATALDIGASNWALTRLPVSFHTVLRSSIPGVVLCFAIALRLERPKPLTVAAVALVCGGVGLASWGELAFDLFGFALALASIGFSALRWVLTQILVHRGAPAAHGGAADHHERLSRKPSPVATLLQVSPAACAATVPLVFIVDAPGLARSEWFADADLRLEILGYLTFTASCVFVLLLAEYALLQLTSSLTLSVLGIFKELLCIAGAVIVFGDAFTPLNAVGFAGCVGGLLAYHVSRVGAMRTELKATAQYDSPALNAVPGADVELRDDAEELGGYVSEAPFSKAAPQSYS